MERAETTVKFEFTERSCRREGEQDHKTSSFKGLDLVL